MSKNTNLCVDSKSHFKWKSTNKKKENLIFLDEVILKDGSDV